MKPIGEQPQPGEQPRSGEQPPPTWRGQTLRWAAVMLFIAAVVVIVRAYLLSHPRIEVPPGNRHEFARIGILVDGTRSMHPGTFPFIKTIVQKKILASLGSNDVAVAFDVQSRFAVAANAVLGIWGDQMPQDSPDRQADVLDILEGHRQDGGHHDPHPEPFYDLVRWLLRYEKPAEEAVRGAWTKRLWSREEPSIRGSDICSPLRELGGFLRDGERDEKRWLFVLSDLENTGPARSCHPDDSFPNARIVLIYPFDPSHPAWQQVLAFWQPFFANRKLERQSFVAALADAALIPPNPTAGLAREIPTMGQAALPLIAPALLLWLSLTAAIAGATAYSSRARHDASRTERGGGNRAAA